MGDNRNKIKERIPMDLATTPVLKVEPARNSPGVSTYLLSPAMVSLLISIYF